MADPARHGRTTISSRAVRRIVSAVTADALDVGPSDVSVDLDDDGGSLHVGFGILGVFEEPAVVHGDDARAACRWDHVVGAVDDVGHAEPPIHRRRSM